MVGAANNEHPKELGQRFNMIIECDLAALFTLVITVIGFWFYRATLD
ncbi:MAG: hypothetical protein WCF20_10960 [Methylovirgula sp.]